MYIASKWGKGRKKEREGERGKEKEKGKGREGEREGNRTEKGREGKGILKVLKSLKLKRLQ